jgi:hypothetical protein
VFDIRATFCAFATSVQGKTRASAGHFDARRENAGFGSARESAAPIAQAPGLATVRQRSMTRAT